MIKSLSKFDTYKFYLTIIFLLLGFLGALFTYSMYDDYDDKSTFFISNSGQDRRVIFFSDGNRIDKGTWYQGGVAIDSAKDGVAAGLGVFSGLLILSSTVLLSKIGKNE
jgi:hypothetical protein